MSLLNNWVAFALLVFIAIAIVQSSIKLLLSFIHWRTRQNECLESVDSQSLPSVTILVPAFNEALIIERTIDNLLQLDYPNYDIIVVDDGSTDQTFDLVKQRAELEDKLSVYHIKNSKRAGALNYGLTKTNAEFLVCTDADSLLDQQSIRVAIRRLMQNENLGAVAGNLRVGNLDRLLTACQSIEYDVLNHSRFAQNVYRKVNLVPGPVGVFRRSILIQAGGFSTETFAEDTDLTAELIENKFDVIYEHDCIVWTEAPNSVKDLYAQRYRWVRGLMQVIKKHRIQSLKGNLFSRLTLLTLANTFAWSFLVSLMLFTASICYVFGALTDVDVSNIGILGIALFSVECVSQIVSVLLLKHRRIKCVLVPIKILVYDSVRCLWAFKFILDEIMQTEMSWNKLARYGSDLGKVASSQQ